MPAALLLGAASAPACAASPPPDPAPPEEVATPFTRSVDCPEIPDDAVADGAPREICRRGELVACGKRAHEACEVGDLEACFRFAAIYDQGSMSLGDDLLHIEVSADRPCALRVYDRSCQLGHLPSCSNLALELLSHPTTPAARARAIPLLERACTSGYALACSNLGMEYTSGTAVPRDAARAAALFQQACDGGEAIGCKNLEWLRAAPERQKSAGEPR